MDADIFDDMTGIWMMKKTKKREPRPLPWERLQRAADRTIGKMQQVESLLRQRPMSKSELAAEIGCCGKTIQRALRDIVRCGGKVEQIITRPNEPHTWRLAKRIPKRK